MELIDGGSLLHALYDMAKYPALDNWEMKLKLAKQAAIAVNYLHTRPKGLYFYTLFAE